MKPQHTPSEARTIERTALDSEALKSSGYSEDRQILAIEFQSGLLMHYDAVPVAVFEAFGAAESRGRFYAREIKGKYKARVMTGLCANCAFPGLVGEACEHCHAGTVRMVEKHRP